MQTIFLLFGKSSDLTVRENNNDDRNLTL